MSGDELDAVQINLDNQENRVLPRASAAMARDDNVAVSDDDRRAALIHIHTRDEIHGVVNDVLQRDDETALKGWGG